MYNTQKVIDLLSEATPEIVNIFEGWGYAYEEFETNRVQILSRKDFLNSYINQLPDKKEFQDKVNELDFEFAIIDDDLESESIGFYDSDFNLLIVFDEVLNDMSDAYLKCCS